MAEVWGVSVETALQNRVLLIEDSDGVVELYEPKSGILYCRMRGIFSYAHALELSRLSSQSVATELHYFSDWGLMESYDSKARATMADWGRFERTRLKTGTFICGNRLVEMGVTVAGMAMAILGIEIKATTREEFNARLAAKCLSTH